jgi:hypothetical protein
VRLTFNNALTYNPVGHEVNTAAMQFLTKFEELYRPIHEKFDERGFDDELQASSWNHVEPERVRERVPEKEKVKKKDIPIPIPPPVKRPEPLPEPASTSNQPSTSNPPIGAVTSSHTFANAGTTGEILEAAQAKGKGPK